MDLPNLSIKTKGESMLVINYISKKLKDLEDLMLAKVSYVIAM